MDMNKIKMAGVMAAEDAAIARLVKQKVDDRKLLPKAKGFDPTKAEPDIVFRPELKDPIMLTGRQSHECGELEELVELIAQWGIDRNITREGGASGFSQMKKLQEEVAELRDALVISHDTETVDGIGDALTVIIQVCRLEGISLVEALTRAWNEIKDRRGTMVNGVFVKEGG